MCLLDLSNRHLLLQVKIKLKCGCEIANEMQSHGHVKIKRKSILEKGKPDASVKARFLQWLCVCRNQQRCCNMFHMANIWRALGAHWPSSEGEQVSTSTYSTHSCIKHLWKSSHPENLFNFFLFAVNLSSAPSKPTCQQDTIFCQTHVPHRTNSVRVWMCVSVGATENKHSAWKHVCQIWAAQNWFHLLKPQYCWL